MATLWGELMVAVRTWEYRDTGMENYGQQQR